MLGDLPVITNVRRDNSHHYDSRRLPCRRIYVGGSDLQVITYVRRDNSHHYDSRSLPCRRVYVRVSPNNYLCKVR